MSARILVVDDMLANVKVLAAKLTREYFDVSTATSGMEALASVAADPPDLILLDVMMPGMDGFEVCRRLKADANTAHIPVVMVTALSEPTDRVRGLEVGADDFLTKPVNDVALFARVRSLVRLKMMMDEWRVREQTAGRAGMNMLQASLEDVAVARCLVVEDSIVDLDRVVRGLGDEHVVVSTPSITEALARGRAEEFDLIVISLALAREDGLRLCSQFRSAERTRATPVLLIAEDSDIDRVAKGLELGANDYIIKPIDCNELLARARIQVRRKRWQERLRQSYEENLSMALVDALTGAFNRRHMDAQLPGLLRRAREAGHPLSFVIFDIDRFKSVNDTWGHPVGDIVLKEVAARTRRVLGDNEMLLRMGGEEFVVLAPGLDLAGGCDLAERIRDVIAATPVPAGPAAGELPITVSLGVAEAAPGETGEDLIHRADEALYRAKRGGRNRVVADAPAILVQLDEAAA